MYGRRARSGAAYRPCRVCCHATREGAQAPFGLGERLSPFELDEAHVRGLEQAPRLRVVPHRGGRDAALAPEAVRQVAVAREPELEREAGQVVGFAEAIEGEPQAELALVLVQREAGVAA